MGTFLVRQNLNIDDPAKSSARKALFLSRLSRREEAIESCLMSIAGFPWNWSAWTLLGSCIGDGDEVVLSVDSKDVY
jgi:hypothetical protein